MTKSRTMLIPLLLTALLAPGQASAASARNQVTVGEIARALDQADTDPTKRQMLTAYLAGLGEAVGIMLASAPQYGASITCERALALDFDVVARALSRARGSNSARAETAATPLLVAEILDRAGCR